MRRVIRFFDRLEDRTRAFLSRHPIFYAIIGGTAIVLFWRGVWYTADLFSFLDGPMSVIISVVILLITGLFVSFFIGDRIVLSGLKHEKKLVEKTESEVKTEFEVLVDIQTKLTRIEAEIQKLKIRS